MPWIAWELSNANNFNFSANKEAPQMVTTKKTESRRAEFLLLTEIGNCYENFILGRGMGYNL